MYATRLFDATSSREEQSGGPFLVGLTRSFLSAHRMPSPSPYCFFLVEGRRQQVQVFSRCTGQCWDSKQGKGNHALAKAKGSRRFGLDRYRICQVYS